MVLETRVLRYIFRSKREELTGYWKKWHCERLYELYFTSIISRMIKMKKGLDEACGAYGVKERCIQGLVGKPEGETTWKNYSSMRV